MELTYLAYLPLLYIFCQFVRFMIDQITLVMFDQRKTCSLFVFEDK